MCMQQDRQIQMLAGQAKEEFYDQQYPSGD